MADLIDHGLYLQPIVMVNGSALENFHFENFLMGPSTGRELVPRSMAPWISQPIQFFILFIVFCSLPFFFNSFYCFLSLTTPPQVLGSITKEKVINLQIGAQPPTNSSRTEHDERNIFHSESNSSSGSEV